MDLGGPPQILMVFPPFLLNDPLIVGCSTRIGTGWSSMAIAAVPTALTVARFTPRALRKMVFATFVTVTWIRFGSSTPDSVTWPLHQSRALQLGYWGSISEAANPFFCPYAIALALAAAEPFPRYRSMTPACAALSAAACALRLVT